MGLVLGRLVYRNPFLLSQRAPFLSLYFRIFLLECSVREVRVAVATILEKTLDSALFYQDKVGLLS